MTKIPMNKTGHMGFPKTPSVWVGKPKYEAVLQLTITAGGGMGGSLWYEYVQPDTIPTNRIKEFVDINGHMVSINTRYIVQVRPVTVVECRTLCANTNYYKVKTEERFRFIIPQGTYVEQENRFAKDDEKYIMIDPDEQ